MSTVPQEKENWRSFLVDYRMAALGLDAIEVSALLPQTFSSLQRVCSCCENGSRCVRDLAGQDPADLAWKDYCRNAIDLMMIDLLLQARRASGKPAWISRSKLAARAET